MVYLLPSLFLPLLVPLLEDIVAVATVTRTKLKLLWDVPGQDL